MSCGCYGCNSYSGCIYVNKYVDPPTPTPVYDIHKVSEFLKACGYEIALMSFLTGEGEGGRGQNTIVTIDEEFIDTEVGDEDVVKAFKFLFDNLQTTQIFGERAISFEYWW